ncbi:replication restart helicase PriA [Psychroflexus salis]|uniref:Replication restart protein PriA n=1 Tax=Psychroflexus salis TaxID=1526574 RepID=A0A917E7Q8_9FLAO|nr:primosomal protein N' [Psychroflexus salis]GGE11471.1 primosomal protein N' [Psychroflexus salis]
MSNYIDVILPLPLKQLFTYEVNDEEVDKIELGMRLAVPFGKSKVYTGLAIQLHKQKPLHYETKPVEQILDEAPLVTKNQMRFWKWIADYYMCSLGEVMKTALPSAFLLESETVIEWNKETEIKAEALDDEEFLLYEALQKQNVLKIHEVMQILDKKTVLPMVKRMAEKGILILNQELNIKYKPKLKKYIRLTEANSTEQKLPDLLNTLSSSPKQKEALLKYFNFSAKTKKPITSNDLSEKAGVSTSVVKALIKKDIFEEYLIKQDRIDFAVAKTRASFQLSEAQQDAMQQIEEGFENREVCLLHGVTSSGKTEIYIQLIEKMLQQEKQVLFLLPEIALTTQLIKRLQAFFGDEVLVFHSKYSQNERVEVYRHVLQQSKGKIVIGARSSLFLPFKNLGLIIVDEAHEVSFKQFDPAPRYHARDAAIVLAHFFKAKTLLGSATPSLESLANVKDQKYAYVRLNKRFGNVMPPKIELVDLKELGRKKQVKGHFSKPLLQALETCIENGKQAILFQNRRGFSPILECKTCGHSPQCPSCDVSLTYHKHNNSLRCHYCGYSMAMQTKCLACSSPDISTKGFGTEQVETELQELYPDWRIQRMDHDTTRRKYAYDRIISSFENHEVDVLIGTQMLTKGLDFRNVDLVGVMNADSLLNFPDFRAFERCFQLLVQVAGRAGRTENQGSVLIQTYNPYHQILQQVTTNDFKSMFKEQLYERKNHAYPPFYRLVKFTLKGRDYNRVNEASDWLATYLKQSFGKQVLGPEFPAVSRIKNKYHKNIQLKIAANQSIIKSKKIIQKVLSSFEAVGQFRSIRVVVNVDPY